MALLPYSATGPATAHRTGWGTVSETGGTWRRRPDPLLDTVKRVGRTAAFTIQYRPVARLGGLRFTGHSGHPLPGALAGSPCLPGLGSGVTSLVGETAPSIQLAGNSYWSVVLKVAAGARTVTVRVKQEVAARLRPKVYVQANPAAGIAAATYTASAGSGWVTVTITFTASSNGGVRLIFHNPDPRGDAYAYFDNITIA